MSEKNEKPKKARRRLSRSALVLIVGIFIIAIPVVIFLSILGISALQTGTPREGSRFDGDLNPAITDTMAESLKNDLATIGSVESVEVKVAQGQVRIYIDVADSATEEQVDSILTTAYNKVNSALPIATYFTSKDNAKMYDLNINVYTKAEADDSRQYKLLHKNSAEEEYGIEDMAHPKNPELVAELQGLTPEPEENAEGEESNGD